jgi:RNA recognition motif-containing protein
MKKIYISCLKKSTRKGDIQEYFSKFGSVKDVAFARDVSTGRNLGFCIVEFSEHSSIEHVLQINDHYLSGKKIKVQEMLLRHELMGQSSNNNSGSDSFSHLSVLNNSFGINFVPLFPQE